MLKNSLAVKKGAALMQNWMREESCKIQSSGQEMAVMIVYWQKFKNDNSGEFLFSNGAFLMEGTSFFYS